MFDPDPIKDKPDLEKHIDNFLGDLGKNILKVAYISIIIYLVFGTGLITYEPKKPAVYQTNFNATGVENIRCDSCFTAPKGFDPNYTFQANSIVR